MIRTKKKFGQHFILSDAITNKIAKSAGDLSNVTVIEIGPGLGNLTRSILRLNPKKLISIEKDRDLIERHYSIIKEYGNVYDIICADALVIDEKKIADPPIKIIANLPYNVSTALLVKWMENPNFYQSFTLMFQKEVADRIIATPGTKDYGRLSILTQLLCDVKKTFDFGPEIFFPPPKVNSSVLQITTLDKPRFFTDIKTLKRIMSVTFCQRRKMLSTSLKQIIYHPERVMEALGIDCRNRPEDLTVEQFCRLALAIMKI